MLFAGTRARHCNKCVLVTCSTSEFAGIGEVTNILVKAREAESIIGRSGLPLLDMLSLKPLNLSFLFHLLESRRILVCRPQCFATHALPSIQLSYESTQFARGWWLYNGLCRIARLGTIHLSKGLPFGSADGIQERLTLGWGCEEIAVEKLGICAAAKVIALGEIEVPQLVVDAASLFQEPSNDVRRIDALLSLEPADIKDVLMHFGGGRKRRRLAYCQVPGAAWPLVLVC